jgi:FxsC-like protein
MAHADYLYFVSYARDDLYIGKKKDTLEEHLSRFLEDLREAVRSKAGRLQEDRVDFRDTEQIGLGQQWRTVVIDALQASRLVLAIYTPTFFTRPECGVELGFMEARRLQHFAAGAQPHEFIIPVIWQPLAENATPAALKGVNYYFADLPAEYKSYGLRALARQQRFSNEYEQSVEAIAAQIEGVRQLALLPPHPDPPAPARLNIFTPLAAGGSAPAPADAVKGPRGVRFAYVAATRPEIAGKPHVTPYGDRCEEWQPSPTDDRQIGMLAPIVAGTSRFIPYPLTVDATLKQQVADAQKDNALVVLLVDVWTACRVTRYRELLQQYDGVGTLNAAALVVWNEQDADIVADKAELEQWLQYVVFPVNHSRGAPYYRPSIESVAALEVTLRETLERLRNEMMVKAEVFRALTSGTFTERPTISNVPPAPPPAET